MYQDVVDLFDDALTSGFAGIEHESHRRVGMVEAERYLGEQVSCERRHSLTSLPRNAQAFGEAVRSRFPCRKIARDFVLDLAFQEDASRMHSEYRLSVMTISCWQ